MTQSIYKHINGFSTLMHIQVDSTGHVGIDDIGSIQDVDGEVGTGGVGGRGNIVGGAGGVEGVDAIGGDICVIG